MPSVQDVIDATFAEQCHLDAQRAQVWAQAHGMRLKGENGLLTVDVFREPLPPQPPEPVAPAEVNAFYCGGCGKVFDTKTFKRAGMAKMQRTRHEKACVKRV